ncbi:MAG: hypothetical protein Q8J78_13245 [Moraxellaceae bacterium]|nr:hypothetical protein [Moraxellaceae bacterium]
MNRFFLPAVLAGGVLFGAGLTFSTMIQPEVVLSFLRFADMGLLLVLGSAVTLALLVYQLAPRRMKKPLLADAFGVHVLGAQKQTLVGAAIFGVGWGISGVCPGPAIAGLGAGNWPLLYALAGLAAGAWLHGWWASH